MGAASGLLVLAFAAAAIAAAVAAFAFAAAVRAAVAAVAAVARTAGAAVARATIAGTARARTVAPRSVAAAARAVGARDVPAARSLLLARGLRGRERVETEACELRASSSRGADRKSVSMISPLWRSSARGAATTTRQKTVAAKIEPRALNGPPITLPPET
jgi:hypothetical protein